MTPIEGLTAVVPAGGAGTRLWPLSRADSPKFLQDLTGSGRTLLQATWDRLAPVACDGVMVVTGPRHAAAVARQLPELPAAQLLVEPSPRDSMPAIGLAAAIVAERDPEALLGSFAADHVVRDQAAFEAAVGEAAAAAREGWLVTIGITPSHAATGFGYIELGRSLEVTGAPSARLTSRFVEKPDAATAESYVEAGYRWNAGMFVVRAGTLLELLAVEHPDLRAGLVRIAQAWPTSDRGEVLAATWPQLTAVAIDHAVAEPASAAGRVACVPADLGWDDVGDWTSLAALLPVPGTEGTTVLGDAASVLAVDASGLVVPAAGREVVVLGVHGVVVVDTPDALLVMSADHAQQVKGVVEALREAGRTDLL